jgi:hypothetical protein
MTLSSLEKLLLHFSNPPDKNIRKWAKDARNASLDLRNSPNILLRKYYLHT